MSERTLHEGELDREDVRELLAMHFAEMRAGSPRDACHVLDLSGLADPAIRFFSLREGETLLCIGALKDLGGGEGEIKSMRAAPEARGKGAGKAMLDHILTQAREAGMERISLETGNSPLFDDAVRLYEKAGFTRCEPFSDYRPTPFTTFFTRQV